MNKNINIPGRLHSVATDGQVAGANEIYDDEQQKFQGEINAELHEEMEDAKEVVDSFDDRVKAIEDLAEISIEGGEVQVANTAEEIVAGSGKVPTANALNERLTSSDYVDDEPVAGSDKLVKSGGVANRLSLFGSKFINKADNITFPNSGVVSYRSAIIHSDENDYKHTDPIQVSRGDIVIVNANFLYAAEVAQVVETDEQKSYYYSLKNAESSWLFFYYIIEKDGYIILNCRINNNRETTYTIFDSETFKQVYDSLYNLDYYDKYFKVQSYVSKSHPFQELYLNGLDNDTDYYVSQFSNNGLIHIDIKTVDGSRVARLHSNTSPMVNTICFIKEENNSGINGYVICSKVLSFVTVDKRFSLINKDIVSSLIYNPSIANYLLDKNIISVKKIYNESGTNLSNNIVWNNGYMYWYVRKAAKYVAYNYTDRTTYKYSSPFFMKAGDVIEWNAYGDDKLALGAVKSGYVFKSNELGPLCPIQHETSALSHYRFVAPIDMWVSVNARSTSIDENHFVWFRSNTVGDANNSLKELELLFPSEKYLPLLEQLRKPETNDGSGSDEQILPLNILHFSDIHEDWNCFNRVCLFKNKFTEYVDDVIVTGDLAGSTYGAYEAGSKSIENIEGFDKILIAIGNHDVYDGQNSGASTSDPTTWATQQQKYTTWLKHISDWGVVQPIGAGENNYYPCYYYKDYTTNNVRLIVLDCMAYDTTQNDWLISVLSSANSADLHVVIADHFAPRISKSDTVGFDCGFHTLTDMTFYQIGNSIQDAVTAVDNFINNGGTFITWLCGHFHWDQVATLASHPKQLYIAVGAANKTEHMQHRKRETGQESEDLFNIVSIDTYSKTISVVRIGSHFNRYLQHQGCMTISYDTDDNKTPSLLTCW